MKMKHLMRTKKNDKNRKIMMILTIINVVLFLASGIMLIFTAHNINILNSTKEKKPTVCTTSSKTTKNKKSSSSKTSSKSKSSSTESETKKDKALTVKFSNELIELVNKNGLNEDDINNLKTSQIVTVNPDNEGANSVTISFFELNNNKWEKNNDLTTSGFVGEQGTTNEMSEEVSATPKGMYTIGDAFYLYDAPTTNLNSFEIMDDTYWVDDPNSKYYNQKVEGVENMDWISAEQMSTIPAYKYGFVIDYNTDCVPGKGSAIFFHIGNVPTAGCIATSEDMVKSYLSLLDKAKNPYILIN